MKKILLAVVVLLVVIQFFRPARNVAAAPSPNDLAAHYPMPPPVKATLETSCFDCHSDTTRYPWYVNLQPVGWWMAHHIKDGKRHLNFSEFAAYNPKIAFRKMKGVANVVTKHEMPLESYTWIHHDAKLTDAQAKEIADWTATVRAAVLAAHPGADVWTPPKRPGQKHAAPASS